MHNYYISCGHHNIAHSYHASVSRGSEVYSKGNCSRCHKGMMYKANGMSYAPNKRIWINEEDE